MAHLLVKVLGQAVDICEFIEFIAIIKNLKICDGFEFKMGPIDEAGQNFVFVSPLNEIKKLENFLFNQKKSSWSLTLLNSK